MAIPPWARLKGALASSSKIETQTLKTPNLNLSQNGNTTSSPSTNHNATINTKPIAADGESQARPSLHFMTSNPCIGQLIGWERINLDAILQMESLPDDDEKVLQLLHRGLQAVWSMRVSGKYTADRVLQVELKELEREYVRKFGSTESNQPQTSLKNGHNTTANDSGVDLLTNPTREAEAQQQPNMELLDMGNDCGHDVLPGNQHMAEHPPRLPTDKTRGRLFSFLKLSQYKRYTRTCFDPPPVSRLPDLILWAKSLVQRWCRYYTLRRLERTKMSCRMKHGVSISHTTTSSEIAFDRLLTCFCPRLGHDTIIRAVASIDGVDAAFVRELIANSTCKTCGLETQASAVEESMAHVAREQEARKNQDVLLERHVRNTYASRLVIGIDDFLRDDGKSDESDRDFFQTYEAANKGGGTRVFWENMFDDEQKPGLIDTMKDEFMREARNRCLTSA